MNDSPEQTGAGLAAPAGSAYDSFKSAIESGDIEHLLWWSDTARALLTEVIYQHADKDSPEYNECDTSRCMWCETAAKLMPNADISDGAKKSMINKSKPSVRKERGRRSLHGVLASIERAMTNAYDVGLCHGMNPMRNFNHQKPKRVNEGWGKYAKKLFKELKPMLANDLRQPPPG